MKSGGPSESGGLKANYDKVLLGLALILLAVSGFFFYARAIGSKKAIEKSIAVDSSKRNVLTPIDVTEQNEFLKKYYNPHEIGEYANEMMVSEIRVQCVNPDRPAPIPYDVNKCPFCAEKQPDVDKFDRDRDGISDDGERKYGLNPLDPYDAAGDLDGDGWSNLVEFRAETNLTDPKEFPSPASQLRLIKAVQTQFPYWFAGIQEGKSGTKYQLNPRRRGGPTLFAKIGETVKGAKLIKLVPKKRMKDTGISVDVSVLVLEQDGKTLELELGRRKNPHEIKALLRYKITQEEYKVRIGESIKVQGYTYNIVDIKRDGVVIKDAQSGESTTIPKISLDEEAQVGSLGGESGSLFNDRRNSNPAKVDLFEELEGSTADEDNPYL